MQFSEFLVAASTIVFYHTALGQNNEVITRDPIERDREVTVNFGDLAIHVTAPLGREEILNTQPFYQQWRDVDGVKYWKLINASPNDISSFQDLSDIPCESVKMKYSRQSDNKDLHEKPTEIHDGHKSEVSTKELNFGYYQNTLKIMEHNSHPHHSKRINPFLHAVKMSTRRKREIGDSEEEKIKLKEVSENDPNHKRKKRNLSLLKSVLGMSGCKSDCPSYCPRCYQPQRYELNCCNDDCNTRGTICKKFVDTAINAVELVGSGICMASRVVSGKIANAMKKLAQPKHVIDLSDCCVVQAVEPICPNNVATECEERCCVVEGIEPINPCNVATDCEERCCQVVETNIDDTNCEIDNADVCGCHREQQYDKECIDIDCDDYDYEEECERFLPDGYRFRRSKNSGSHDFGKVNSSNDAIIDINSGSASGIQSKSSIHHDSHLDIGETRSPIINSPDHHDAINSVVQSGVEIHTSRDAKLGGHFDREIQSSVNSDSHLDIGISRANDVSGVDERSEIVADGKGPNEKVVEQICADVLPGKTDLRKQDCYPNVGFETIDPVEHSYDCKNCRKVFNTETNRFCPNCGTPHNTFLSDGTIQLDKPKQNFKRTVDPSKSIELYPEHTCGYNRSINLKKNCSDETFGQSLDRKDLNDNP